MAGAIISFKAGQRWVSQSEPALGLGVVVEASGRRVTLRFDAVEEERTYATDSAPLSRAEFTPGDRVRLRDQREVIITQAMSQAGLMLYAGQNGQGEECVFPETELCDEIRLHAPDQRLKSGVVDRLSAFRLRVEALTQRARVQQSPARGLMGARTQLLPHQLYIGWEVSRRLAPRVLLADEVGLGKTIEAGMILHRQLLTGLAQRALVLVPETLINQWLIEMLRRFSLGFRLLDRAQIESLQESQPDENPFESAQLVLCPLSLLSEDARLRNQAAEAGWDLLIVDEAHHLHWSPEGGDAAYQCVEALSRASKGLLLLTATPEQAGAVSHFARLRLLDPDRFHDLEAFQAEEARYESLIPVIQRLIDSDGPIDPEHRNSLQEWLPESSLDTLTPPQMIEAILDQYGTGRVLFRNSRAAIEGFPDRHVTGYPLSLTASYQHLRGAEALQPETSLSKEQWLEEDPRVSWLTDLFSQHRKDKILVICAHRQTAEALARHLSLRAGTRCADFHEGLSLIERDRAAAYFADPDEGAQALICSEIGSEGRNFQFARHLVLFDLPLNPDLLEQRIGRLDRIGQRHTVEIHAPYFEGSAQEVLYRWYAEGMDAFEHSFSAGQAVYEQLEDALQQQMAAPDSATGLNDLISRTRTLTQSIRDASARGRAPLLELNSCRTEVADTLIDAVIETETSGNLKSFFEDLCDLFGAHHEEHSHHALIIKPTDQMLTGHFPGLGNREALTVTFNREQALRREDMSFLSWEHPIVEECLDMLLSSELGNATVVTLPLAGVAAGTLLLEAFFCPALSLPARHPLSQHLPQAPVRILTNIQGKELGSLLSHEQLNDLCQPVKRRMVPDLIKKLGAPVSDLTGFALQQASQQLPGYVEQARNSVKETVTAEIERLKRLREKNPGVRTEEIDGLATLLQETLSKIEETRLAPEAYRLVITTAAD